MKFWEHESIYDYVKRDLGPKFPYRDWASFYASTLVSIRRQVAETLVPGDSHSLSLQASLATASRAEADWYHAVRPYYKVWPAFVPVLSRCRLDISPAELTLKHRVFAVRFADKHELKAGTLACGSFLTTIHEGQLVTGGVFDMLFVFPIVFHDRERIWDGVHWWAIRVNSAPDGPGNSETLEDALAAVGEQWKPRDEFPEEQEMRGLVVRTALSLHMLADDPDFVRPDVLADDRNRFDDTSDESRRQRMIQKAQRRGIVGWRVGEHYESIPHMRRPHFGWRWTGRRRTVPKLVPIKGSIVHRHKVVTVPTGHVEDSGTEVEA